MHFFPYNRALCTVSFNLIYIVLYSVVYSILFILYSLLLYYCLPYPIVFLLTFTALKLVLTAMTKKFATYGTSKGYFILSCENHSISQRTVRIYKPI